MPNCWPGVRKAFAWKILPPAGDDPHHVAQLLSMARIATLLDASLDRTDSDQTLADGLVDEDALSPEDITHAHGVDGLLQEWLAALSARERSEVLEGRFGLHDQTPKRWTCSVNAWGLRASECARCKTDPAQLKRTLGRKGISRQSLL